MRYVLQTNKLMVNLVFTLDFSLSLPISGVVFQDILRKASNIFFLVSFLTLSCNRFILLLLVTICFSPSISICASYIIKYVVIVESLHQRAQLIF